MRERIPALDAARGISALVVLAVHVWTVILQPTMPTWTVDLAKLAGVYAVGVFFALSGHAIGGSIRNRFEWKAYAMARFKRIYPPLLGSIPVCLACWAIVHMLGLPGSVEPLLGTEREWVQIRPTDIPRALLMANGMLEINGPLWSLYIECQIYLVAMLVAMRRPWSVAIAIAFSAVMALRSDKFLLYGAVWLAAALASRITITKAPLPDWITRPADYSYSLYITHFPVLLVCASVAQLYPDARNGIALAAMLALPAFAAAFAAVFERWHVKRVDFALT